MGATTELDEITTLQVTLEPSPTGLTLYERTSELYVWLCLAAVAAMTVVGHRRGRPVAKAKAKAKTETHAKTKTRKTRRRH